MKNNFVPFDVTGFTFGFEVEGAFHRYLLDNLKSGGKFKPDGSVNINDGLNTIDGDDRVRVGGNDDYYATEYASPVFRNLDTAIEQLSLFTKPYYYSNKTCGIHFHIGYKERFAIFNKFMDKPICEQLQNQFMPLVCKCVQERVEANHWCNLHNTFNGGFANFDKYRAVHFHSGYNTIELRLFAPCKHLMNNLRVVLTEFFRVGYRDYMHKPKAICCIFNADKKIEINEVAKVEPKKYDYGFNKNAVFAISPLAMAEDFKEYDRNRSEIEGNYQLFKTYRDYTNGKELETLGRTC
jgi:hypothetical protein